MSRITSFVVITAATLSIAAPAFAHNEINPSTIPPNKPVYLVVNAPNESEADLVKVRIEAPEGLPLGELTMAPTGWTVEGDEAIKTFSGGKLGPSQFAEFGIETEGAPQAGDLEVKITETFSDGSSDSGTVVVSVKAADAATSTTTAPTESSSEGPGPTASAASKDDDGAASAALVVAIVAAVLAVAALAFALSKGKRAAAATSEKSDW